MPLCFSKNSCPLMFHIPCQAKDALSRRIDDYIRDRIIIADQVIEETAAKKIKDGDVILTYARCVPLSCHDGCTFPITIVPGA